MHNQLLMLGTSDGVASPRRNHASILLTMDDTVLLLDCGEPCSHTMVKHGVPADLIDGVLISHMHSDHVGGYPMVIQWFWLASRVKPLPVHMPAEGIGPMRELLKATYLFDELLKFPLTMKPLDPAKPFQIGPLNIETVTNRHLEGLRTSFQPKYHNPFESFSFRITHGKTSVVYSGDIASPEDLQPLLREPTHVLVVELAHFEPESLFKMLAVQQIDQIVITHLGAHIQGALPRTRKLCAKHLPKNKVVFADDEAVLSF